MKTYRILVVVLALLVVLFAYLWRSGSAKPVVEQPKDMWHTNTVELWHTNSVEKWRTNIVQVERTNTVVQTLTNEMIKEIPAKLTAQEKQAGAAGYRYLNAPALADGGSPLYKASPLAVDVHFDGGATNVIAENADAVRKNVEAALSSRGIPVAARSPYRLSLGISASWTTDVPRVAVVTLRLDLKETVSLQRQSDVIKCPAVVWSTSSSRLVRTVNTPEELRKAVGHTVDKFCDDYVKARENEKEVESRLPAVPRGFLQ